VKTENEIGMDYGKINVSRRTGVAGVGHYKDVI